MKKRSALRPGASLLFVLSFLAAFCAFLGAATVPAEANEKYAAIVYDANSGRTLFARHAEARRFPASLTKMMTLYVLFEELEAGRIDLGTRMHVSANAARQSPSKIGVRAGSSIKVEDAILALVTKSANDVAVVVAEKLGGSVSGFATRMNRTAKALGMTGTTFRNPHGLPNSAQVTTARDMVRLAQALQDNFPTQYEYFGTRKFTYRGASYRNHNRLLGSVEGVDGIKTGYTRSSGFNLVSNVKRDGRHIIAVVMGGRTAASRDAHMRELIAEHLPKGSRGDRTEPVLSGDLGGDVFVEAARIPRARPIEETSALMSYAPAVTPRDVVSAAMAAAAPAEGDGVEADAVEAKPVAEAAATSDPIAARIEAATEVAALALADMPQSSDPIARLEQLARIRAGSDADIIAAPRLPADGEARTGEEGWHIQIGAVPTEDGAQALIEKAQASLGTVLASVSPFTQEVERDGETLYRARFAGFSDKEEARDACAKLKKKSFACLALPN